MKKKIILILSAVLLVALSVAGTVAFLTDQKEVKNTFTVGNVIIKLDEAAVDTDGVVIPNQDRVTENNYHLLPGKTYTKDPQVTIEKNSEDSYIRMLVTITNYSELKNVLGENFKIEECINNWDQEKWIITNKKENNDDSITYEFRYYKVVNGKDSEVKLEPLFTSFTVPATLDSEELAKFENAEIKVIAHAIQASGFADANEAWQAFSDQNGTN